RTTPRSRWSWARKAVDVRRDWLPPEPPKLWAAYLAGRGDRDRNALVMHYEPIVRTCVGARARRLDNQPAFGKEDVAQDLMLVLQELVEAYDPSRGVPFGRWAAMLIPLRWAQAVREYDEVDRRMRAAGEAPVRGSLS